MADILEQNREQLLLLPAAKKNHHAFVSGYLEHVLNVTRTCCHLADKYAELYNDLDPPLNKDVIVAGAVLHDIGKLRELAVTPAGAEYTAAGLPHRPRAARPRHRPRGGRRPRDRSRNCCCGWST